MKKKLIINFIVIVMFSALNVCAKNVSTLSDSQIQNMNTTVDFIYKKLYSGSFLSPVDTSSLIGIKIKLDDETLISKDDRYANIYYKLGRIYQKRGENKEAIECYKAIVDDYVNSSVAPKAIQQLKIYGINVSAPQVQQDEEE